MKIYPIGNPAIVKQSLVAKTRNGLTRKMLLNNLKLNSQLEYEIMKDGSIWVAWYYFEIKIGDINELS
jgi:hypothetical protein